MWLSDSFHKMLLQNISLKLLEKRDWSFLSLHLGTTKENITVHPYFCTATWKMICFLLLEIIQVVALLSEIVDKKFNQNTFSVSECIFKKVCLCDYYESCSKPEIDKSSRSQMLFKIGALKIKFRNIHRKASALECNFNKKRLQ